MRQRGYTADKLELLNKASGLKGISGIRGYAPDYGGARRRQPTCQMALDIFVHRLRSSIAMLASLGIRCSGVWRVGENYATIRAAACEAFEFLGLRLDTEKCLLACCSRHQHGEFSGGVW